jgi:hypothetical protein
MATCVVLIPVVPKMRQKPSLPMRAGEGDVAFIGNNMQPIFSELQEKSIRTLPGEALCEAATSPGGE